MKYAKDYFDYVLEDDDTEFGGISFIGETLRDFCTEENIDNFTYIEDVNKLLVECGIKPIPFHKRYCMIFDMPDCCDGIEFDNFEEAKNDAIETLIQWMVETIMEYGEDNIEEWNYLIYNFNTYVCEWNTETQEYEEIWCPSYEDEKEIGWVEK